MKPGGNKRWDMNTKEKRNAIELAKLAIITFMITCIMAGCSNREYHNDNYSIDDFIWSISDKAWSWCEDDMNRQGKYDYTDIDITVHYICHYYECEIISEL